MHIRAFADYYKAFPKCPKFSTILAHTCKAQEVKGEDCVRGKDSSYTRHFGAETQC